MPYAVAMGTVGLQERVGRFALGGVQWSAVRDQSDCSGRSVMGCSAIAVRLQQEECRRGEVRLQYDCNGRSVMGRSAIAVRLQREECRGWNASTMEIRFQAELSKTFVLERKYDGNTSRRA